MPTLRLVLLATLTLLVGCAGGPSYAGGPTDEEAHAVVIPGPDVTIWQIDGYDVSSRGGAAYVAPGRRKLKVRFEYSIDSESATPWEYKVLDLNIEDGQTYLIERTGEGMFGPFDVQVRQAPRR